MAFVMRGQVGDIRRGYQVAAEFATWTLSRDGPEWSLEAQLKNVNAYRLSRGGPFDLCLHVGGHTWRWRGVEPQISESALTAQGRESPEVL